MLGTHDLLIFIFAGWLLNITPGPDTALIVARSMLATLIPSSRTSEVEFRAPFAVKFVLLCPPGFKFEGVTPGVNCTSDRGVRPARGSDKMYLLSTT